MAYLNVHDDRLLFLPLGGSGEIGMNLNLYGYKGQWVMVDCGMMFADSYTPGVDLILPDTSFIEGEKKALAGMLITHAHEDHIGAVPYLWERFGCDVYATPFTAALIKEKLKEAGLEDQVPLHIVEARKGFAIGPFEARYIPLAHSIAEGHGIALTCDKGTIFHTGDWKLDDRPLIGPVCPSEELTALGEAGVLAMVGDSTNVFNPNESGSEADVRENLIKLVSTMEKRVVITTFASNVARLETIGEVAKATGRHLALMGRSMQRIYKAAKETGYLKGFPKPIDQDDVDDIPREKILIACTGCQGEPRAAIARIARDEHKTVHLSPGDTVLFSSKIIPGNEITLGALFNDLVTKKINVVTEKDAFIHVSGHPGRAELKRMYDWVKPHCAIPVHGETRHLMRHAEFAAELGVKHRIVPKNGDVIAISDEGLELVDQVTAGRLALDGTEIIAVEDTALAERRRASTNGFVTASLVFDADGTLAAEPALAILGLPRGDEDAFYNQLVDQLEAALDRMTAKGRNSDADIEEMCRISVRRFCRKTIGKNPGVATLITRRHHIDFGGTTEKMR
jgi:ribonuclease J